MLSSYTWEVNWRRTYCMLSMQDITRISKAIQAFAMLNPLDLTFTLRLESLSRISSAYPPVWTEMLEDLCSIREKTWTLTKPMSIQCIFKIFWPNIIISNEELLNGTGMSIISEKIPKRLQNWLGHIIMSFTCPLPRVTWGKRNREVSKRRSGDDLKIRGHIALRS